MTEKIRNNHHKDFDRSPKMLANFVWLKLIIRVTVARNPAIAL